MTKKKKAKKSNIRYRPNMSIGAMSAEEDDKFLDSCYIETSDFEVITDFENPKCILLGRTGVGKSAALLRIKKNHEHIIEVEPQTLALNYISSSTILRVFSKIGVKLDLFYKLLWQHVICVEILKYHFKLRDESDFRKFKDWVASTLHLNKSTEFATNYLQRWNTKFWAEREERIKEITENLENQIMAEVGAEAYGIAASLSESQNVSQEIKSEIVYKAQDVVNKIQIQELSQLIEVINTQLLNNSQKKHFITIDGLDEDWVDDELRYKLIRALIEAVKKFRKIRNLKIVLSLRTDLLERVYRNTRDSGFQEEKYEDLNLRISWSKPQLQDILDSRIDHLFHHIYANNKVLGFYDIFPKNVKNDNKPTLDYILQRTLMRPRDAIAFVNTILEHAAGSESISGKIILESERVHSQRRYHALLQEWYAEYPKLKVCSELLFNMPTNFLISAITDQALDNIALKLVDEPESIDQIEKQVRRQLATKIDYINLRLSILELFFKVGFIGIRTQSTHPYVFSTARQATIDTMNLPADAKVQIHPMMRLAFGNTKIRGELGGEEESE